MFGTDRIDNISRHVREITQSPEAWRNFLDTVSRFPEFSFYENLAIHSKMADARLETVNPAAHDELYRRLSDKYAIPAFTLPRTLDGLAVELARNNLHAAYTEDSGIDETAFALLMRYSFCYVLARKCGVEPNIPENAFDSISNMNTYPKLNALGTAVVELCRTIVKDIEQILEEIQPEINQQKGSEKMNEPKKDRLKEITDSLEQGIKDLFSSGKYAEYLRTMSNFHNYSYNNILLIHSQKPNATLVAGFNKWKDKFSRYVKKGEKGIQIIAPVVYKRKVEEVKTDPDTGAPILDKDGNAIIEEKEVQSARFKVVSVFDVSQTDGKPLPQLADELKGDVKHFDEFVEALKRSAPVPVEFKPMQESIDGYFSNSEQKIAIREGMSEVQTVCALVHEIAHSKLHNTAILNEAKENPKNNRTQEVEAESISYAVCQYYGIETAENSFGYIATWSKDKELSELKSSLETISKTSNELINDIDRNFREICKERGIDLTKEEQTAEEPVNEETEQTAETESISETSSEDMATVEVKDEESAEPVKEEVDAESISEAPIEEQSVAEVEQTAEENAPTPSEVEETSEDLPDPTLTVKEMNDSGYLKEDMLPISKERAAEFMEQDITVYALHSDNTEEMLFDVSEIEEQSGNMFGIAREDWEQVKESVHSRDNEKRFLSEDRNSFLIYQLKEDAPNELRFASLREIGSNPDKENYAAVYMGLTEKITDPIETLDKLYNDFNTDRPKDFKGHSMSVSDVVALKKDGEVTFHFVDSIGFKELPDFAKDMVLDTPIKEESKLPTVAELKEQAMSGKPISLMDLAAAVQREDKPKSILSKLKAPAVRQDKPKAPKKGAEMEL